MTDGAASLGLSVRTRITAAVAILVALALGATGVLVYTLGADRVESQTVPDAIEQKMAELQRFQAKGVDPRTGRPFTAIEPLVREFLQRSVASPSELLVGIWDGAVQVSNASSRVELRDDPAFLDAVLPLVETGGADHIQTRWGDVHLDVLPLRAEGDPAEVGAFVVAYFVEDELAPIQRTMRTYAVAACMALVLVTLVAAWVAGRLLAPVRTLRETADEISGTDLTRRIPEVGNDDLTDLTRTVNAMLGRLERAFAGQRAFLDDAGHELRTPLTILRGHLELVDARDVEDVEHTRELLLDEVDRMSRLVDDMILLTKTDRPGFLSVATADVTALLRSVADKVRGLGDRDWQVEPGATGEVEVDEQRMTQALVQLAHNAVKHTGAGDTITLGSDDGPAGAVRLWVCDSGPGVPDDDKLTVFRRFSRGRYTADEGAGLGLSIVAAIAAAHGGTAHVEDAEPPPGACFVVTLPRTRKEPTWLAS
ncbi:MAG TPA: ATP-binding protein [Marmoricola sp.]|nr:ATP-binding protein [Marmoricola sp.]